VRALPGFVLPEQLSSDPVPTGAERLSRAVLEEALTTYTRGGGAPARDGPRTALEQAHTDAGAWFASDDASWPFSFVSICETLHLNAGRIRAALGSPEAAHSALLARRITHPHPPPIEPNRRVHRKKK
jgi:uncharacterized alpha-E superfamily protein